jgi:HSP20 family protein
MNSVDLDTDDDGNRVVATFELPGLQKSEVKIEVHNGILIISGEKKQLLPRVRNVHSIQERFYGPFVRSLHLPNGTSVSTIIIVKNKVLIKGG